MDQRDTQIIIANLHWRYSGVTATNRMVAPKIAGDDTCALARLRCAAGHCTPWGSVIYWRCGDGAPPVVWHARRNNEMIVGVVLKALGWPFKLLFTSAAQRHHSWITRWLIRRMDAVIATSDASGVVSETQCRRHHTRCRYDALFAGDR